MCESTCSKPIGLMSLSKAPGFQGMPPFFKSRPTKEGVEGRGERKGGDDKCDGGTEGGRDVYLN